MEIALFVGIAISTILALALIFASSKLRAQQRILAQRIEAQAVEIQHQQELLERNLGVQEEERKRIATQLHDDICSKLGVLHLTFHRLRRIEADNAQYDEMCDEINDLIANTLETTRTMSHELVPPTLEGFGLLEALDELCEQIRNTGAVDIRFEHNVTRTDLRDVTTELNLFRIVQELANNSLKYAEASYIQVQLMKDEEEIRLCYSDNGNGFDMEDNASKGLGLKNIKNRAKIIGAQCNISTEPGHGFEMTVTWLV
ncbi:MAG: sensor histidine kinase [Saprospiraceae bacterium]